MSGDIPFVTRKLEVRGHECIYFLFSLEILLIISHFSFFAEDVVKDIRVSCNSDDMTVTFYTTEVEFNGLVYPKGLSKNSSCMTEYIKHQSAVTYVIPLR